MTRAVTDVQVARMRLAAQHLAGGRLPAPPDVVAHLTCTQSQDWRGCRLAIAARTASRSLEQVDAAYNDGSIVRSWPMRGTLHTVLAADLRWMLAVTGNRIRTQYRSRMSALGIGEACVARAREVSAQALQGGGALTRRELLDRWSSEGIDITGQRSAHLLIDLSIDTVICLGPIRGGVQQFVLCDEWLPAPRQPADPILEWGRRYLTSHGPASRADFLGWTKLLVREVEPLWEQIVNGLEMVELSGATLYATPQVVQAGASRGTLRPVLTAAFDEILLGYADRSATLPAQFRDRVVPGGNGMFKPVVIDGGRAVGTWSRANTALGPPQIQFFGPSPGRRLATTTWRMPAS